MTVTQSQSCCTLNYAAKQEGLLWGQQQCETEEWGKTFPFTVIHCSFYSTFWSFIMISVYNGHIVRLGEFFPFDSSVLFSTVKRNVPVAGSRALTWCAPVWSEPAPAAHLSNCRPLLVRKNNLFVPHAQLCQQIANWTLRTLSINWLTIPEMIQSFFYQKYNDWKYPVCYLWRTFQNQVHMLHRVKNTDKTKIRMLKK